MAVWIEKFITPNAYTRPQSKLTAVKKLVVHYTANNGATAMNHYNYFNTERSSYASAHIFVDKTEAVCIIPLNEVAYHANDVQRSNADGSPWRGVPELLPNANFLSIGVEMCLESDGTFHPQTIARTEDVFVELCKQFKLDPVRDIVRHHDVTYKNCPAPWVVNAQLFIDFRNRVEAKFKGSSPAPTPVAPVQTAHPVQVSGSLPSGALGEATISADVLNIHNSYDLNSPVVGTVSKGQKFPVFKIVNEFYLIGTGMWISNIGGKYATYTLAPPPVPMESPVFCMKTVVYAKVKSVANNDVRKAPTHNSEFVRNTVADEVFDAYDFVNGFYNVGGANWIDGKNATIIQQIHPNPVEPVVAPVEHIYRVRKSWADSASQIGAYKDLNGAKTVADQNAGFNVFDETGKEVYSPVTHVAPTPVEQPVTPKAEPTPVAPVAPVVVPPVVEPVKPTTVVAPVQPVAPTQPVQPVQPTPIPVIDHTGHHDIMGESVVDFEKMVAFVKVENPNAQDIEEIALDFIEVGREYGIRGDVAFCQSIIETGYFKFDGGTAVTPDQHNYAGIGVTSKGMKGNSFAVVKDGVKAQIQHLFAYASTDNIPNGDNVLDPRFQYVARGIAPHWEDLDNRWAMNSQYGQDILAVYDKLTSFTIPTPVAPVVEQPPVTQETPASDAVEAEQVKVAKSLIDYLIEKLKGLFGK